MLESNAAGSAAPMNNDHGSQTSHTHKDTGRLSTLTAPNAKTWTYAYNAVGQPTQVNIPNGTTTHYGYDTRNRLTSIHHNDGNTVLDGWDYTPSAGGNITRTDQANGSYWTYAYDGRNRLTTADRYEASGSTIHAHYAYTYDLADNLTQKVEPFVDTFQDGNASGWNLNTGWAASNGYLSENASGWVWVIKGNTKADLDLRVTYRTSDTATTAKGSVFFRWQNDNTNGQYVDIYPQRMDLVKRG